MSEMTSRGILIVLSGFSGAGKGTIITELLKRYQDKYSLSISATTRQPRSGEVCGREYFFKDIEEFEKMIAENQMIEYARYVGNYYGTPRDFVEKQLELGKDVILEIEIQGAIQVKETYPEALLLFVTPPTVRSLRERLIRRGTETKDVIQSRLEQAVAESKVMINYDYIIVNDKLDTCVEEVHNIVQGEHFRVFRNQEFIDKIESDLISISKGDS
jgi:guanylate kinase